MSLLPFFLDNFYPFKTPPLIDQYFGVNLNRDDFTRQFSVSHHIRVLTRKPLHDRHWQKYSIQSDLLPSLSDDKDKFQINLDVQHFTSDEITVKVTNNTILVEGKHEEKEDEHGFISRNFVRKYILPEGHDIEKIETLLSSDGVLTITAPKIDTDDRSIPIHQTGYPFPIEYKPREMEE